jgi:outer membrane biosynthesis protein TonB
MNKKKLIIVLSVILVVAVAAAIVISKDKTPDGQQHAGTGQQGAASAQDAQNNGTDDTTTTTGSVDTTPNTVPEVSVEIGVGEYKPGSYGDEDQSGSPTSQTPTTGTQPTKPQKDEPSAESKPSEDSKPSETPQPEQNGEFRELTWEEYDALDVAGVTAYMENFPGGLPAFVAWFNKAKEEANKNDIIIGEDGVIDLGGAR